MRNPEKLINDLVQLSRDYHDRVDEMESDDFVQFIEHREHLIARVKQYPWTAAEREQYSHVIREILEQDAIMLERMTVLRQEAMSQMKRIDAGHKNKATYSSYNQHADSVFFDQKK